MIQIALVTEYKLPKPAQAAEIIRTVHAAFLSAGLDRPRFRFTMLDGLGKVSSVERVLRRFPALQPFDHTRPVNRPSEETERLIGNEAGSPGVHASIDLPTILDVAAGIPKRYPFSKATIRLTDPVFGPDCASTTLAYPPGLVIADRWRISKRRITLTAVAVVDADPAGAAGPVAPDPVTAVLNACGRHGSPRQVALSGQVAGARERAAAIHKELFSRLDEIAERARMPHDLFPREKRSPMQPAGPRKPALASALRPLGYDCRGAGVMILECSRRTASNNTVKLTVELGTLGPHVSASYSVYGLGGGASFLLPLSPASKRHQVWIVDDVHWQQIAENLAALVAELDKSVLPDIEHALGPSPSWFNPDGR